MYRLKFNSKEDFSRALQTLKFNENMARYVEKFQALNNVPRLSKLPEINSCDDDMVIYICSEELDYSIGIKAGFQKITYFESYFRYMFKSAEIKICRQI